MRFLIRSTAYLTLGAVIGAGVGVLVAYYREMT